MIDPLKEPVLSLMLSQECPIEVVPLLEIAPISDLNRKLPVSGSYQPLPHKDSQLSVLEVFLLRNSGHRFDTPPGAITVPCQIALKLVEQGASLSNTGMWSDGTKWDILDLAFNHGHYRFVRHLLEDPLAHLTPSLNGRMTKNQETWLQTLVRLNNIEFVKKLLEWGVDCNAVSELSRTALYYTKTPEMLCVLLENGARIDAVDVDKWGQSLSDHWNKELPSVEVKKLNNILFKVLKKSGELDEHLMRSSWMDSVLQSTKGVIIDQQKKLKIPADFTWEKDGMKCSPMTWIALREISPRSEFQQKKITDHFANDPQHMEIGKWDNKSVSNLDMLTFLETMLEYTHKNSLCWPAQNYYVKKWMNENAHLNGNDRLEKLCATFTNTALLVQSTPWASSMVKKTVFEWYKTMWTGREQALAAYKFIPRFWSEQLSENGDVSKALQKAWDDPLTETLKEYAFLSCDFDKKSLVCLYDLVQSPSATQDKKIKNIVRALTHDSARSSKYYFAQKMIYMPVDEKYANEFNAILDQALDLIEGARFGLLFEDTEWARLEKVYKIPNHLTSKESNYAKWERLKALMERETIHRTIHAVPPAFVKRKM